MLFMLGVAVGAVIATVLWLLLAQSDVVSWIDRRVRTGRVAELERALEQVKAESAEAIRLEKLRSARQFGQYKILLRRADRALAEARAERRATDKTSLDQAA